MSNDRENEIRWGKIKWKEAPTAEHREKLKNCYLKSLDLVKSNKLKSIVNFLSISIHFISLTLFLF